MSKIKDVSKNIEAEKIVGLRKSSENSSPLFFPVEMGFYCPICKAEIMKSLNNINESNTLSFSEYEYFMWCPVCNLDIPSILCKFRREPNLEIKQLKGKEKILQQTSIFLDILGDFRKKILKEKGVLE